MIRDFKDGQADMLFVFGAKTAGIRTAAGGGGKGQRHGSWPLKAGQPQVSLRVAGDARGLCAMFRAVFAEPHGTVFDEDLRRQQFPADPAGGLSGG
jgi:hypothetical protein